jgi:hypothetical protein
MPRYRLIALDLDGTLLNSALRLSDTNAGALTRAIEAGVRVVFATARWFALAKRTADRLGVETPLICSNGALVKRPAGGAELLHLYLDEQLAREAVTLGDDSGWEMFTAIGDSTYMQMRPGIIPEKLPGGLKIADRQSDHLHEGPPTAVLIYGEEAVAEIGRRFLPQFRDRARFSFNRPAGVPYVVLTHPEAEKGSALQMVCRELDVSPTEALAMGDSESDLGMLQLAGLGIAMGNAPDEVKRAALHIAPTNDDDGVAWAIDRFVL